MGFFLEAEKINLENSTKGKRGGSSPADIFEICEQFGVAEKIDQWDKDGPK